MSPDITELIIAIIMNIKNTTAITFPQPILPMSLNASGMFKASPRLSVFASLDSAIVSMNKKIRNKITATIPVIAIAVPKLANVDWGTILLATAVVLAEAFTDEVAILEKTSADKPNRFVIPPTIKTIIAGIIK